MFLIQCDECRCFLKSKTDDKDWSRPAETRTLRVSWAEGFPTVGSAVRAARAAGWAAYGALRARAVVVVALCPEHHTLDEQGLRDLRHRADRQADDVDRRAHMSKFPMAWKD